MIGKTGKWSENFFFVSVTLIMPSGDIVIFSLIF